MAKFEGFDDCEICRAMKVAENLGVDLSESGLKAAFDRQNKTGHGFSGMGEDLEKMEF